VKKMRWIASATWMLEHLTFGLASDAMTGDLLEQWENGRSAGWYWRQTLAAVVLAQCGVLREWALPVVFAAAWSAGYPAWQFLCQGAAASLSAAG
jgi:hypothetical protein